MSHMGTLKSRYKCKIYLIMEVMMVVIVTMMVVIVTMMVVTMMVVKMLHSSCPAFATN